MVRKYSKRPKTIIVLLIILGIALLLLFPVNTVATEFNITIDPELAKNSTFNATAVLKKVTQQVNKDFQYKNTQPIEVIVYSRVKFAKALENMPTWVEAAYDGKIHIAVPTSQSDFEMVTSQIVHEYTHLVVADITHNNCPRWFNEGLARYEESKYGVQPHLYLLGMAYNSDVLIPWDEINTKITSSNSNETLLAYQQSYSFVLYLVENYGMSKIVALLNALGTKLDFDAAIQKTYDMPLETLQTNWHEWLVRYIKKWANAPIVE